MMLNVEKEYKKQGLEGDSKQLSLRLNPGDNVVIALQDLLAGTSLRDEITEQAYATAAAIPRGHKIASHPIALGENVVRYGQIIGQATCDICTRRSRT